MPITLPIDMEDRQFEIGLHCICDGFGGDGEDYEGIALVLEIKTEEEAQAIAAALLADHPAD